MLTPLPLDTVNAKLAAWAHSPVFVFVWSDEQWDVFKPLASEVSKSGIFRCEAAPEISGRDWIRLFGMGGLSEPPMTAYPDVSSVFAVILGIEEAKAFHDQMLAIQTGYEVDMRGPLLKMHTAMSVLQAAVDD